MTSHILRQKHLKVLHEEYIHFVNEGCYPLILEIFKGYKKWIKQQAEIDHNFQTIQISYEDQCKNDIPVNHLRQMITDELQKMGSIDTSLLPNYFSSIHSEHNDIIYQNQQLTNTKTDENSTHSNNSNMVVINGIHVTMQKTVRQAVNNSNMLDNMIKQLRRRVTNTTPN
jgi:transcriptional regulator NrdR family protein